MFQLSGVHCKTPRAENSFSSSSLDSGAVSSLASRTGVDSTKFDRNPDNSSGFFQHKLRPLLSVDKPTCQTHCLSCDPSYQGLGFRGLGFRFYGFRFRVSGLAECWQSRISKQTHRIFAILNLGIAARRRLLHLNCLNCSLIF